MKTQSEFDCVEMKRRIQAKLIVEERGMNVVGRNCEAQQCGQADPVMGPWITNLFAAVEQSQPHACVAEAPTNYGEGKE